MAKTTDIKDKVKVCSDTLMQKLEDTNSSLHYKTAASKSLSAYEDFINENLSSITNYEDFRTHHTEAKTVAITCFEDSMSGLEVANIQVCRVKFLKELELIFEELKDWFETQLQPNIDNSNSTPSSPSAPAIGIDLGTTNCCVGVYWNDKVIIVPNQKYTGESTTPSYVRFNQDGTTTIGSPAKDMAYKNTAATIFDTKRLIGRRFQEDVVQEDIKLWPFSVTEMEGTPRVDIGGECHHPEEISAYLLREMRELVESHLGLGQNSIQKAVITVPAYFTDGQRQATIDAGGIAGLEVLTILNEPTAAAISYLFNRLDKTKKKVLIYDLGGGTFDVAILDVSDGNIRVLGVDGDTHLGGVDFDKNLMNFCAAEFKTETGIDLVCNKDSTVQQEREQSRRALTRLQSKCEQMKKYLGLATSIEISLDGLVKEHDLTVVVTRDKFNEINQQLFQRTIDIVDRALMSVKVEKGAIDDIVLVGGSSRIPRIQELLKQYFDGATLNISINPDEAVAYGAAVQAAVITGVASDTIKINQLQDVTARSLGIRTLDGGVSIIIPKNTTVPTQLKRTYWTSEDNQEETTIDIFEGEDLVAMNNVRLGDFVLSGIPPAPKGTEYFDVTMVINSMGILHVEAVSQTSETAKNSITVQEKKDRLSPAEINGLNDKIRPNPKPLPRTKK